MNDLLGHAPNYEWDIARCDLRQWPDDGHSAKVGKRRCVWIMNWPPLYVTVVPHVWCCRWCGTLVGGWWYWRYESIFQLIPRSPIKKQVIKRKIDREIWDQRWPNWKTGISIRDFASPWCFHVLRSRDSVCEETARMRRHCREHPKGTVLCVQCEYHSWKPFRFQSDENRFQNSLRRQLDGFIE